MLISTIGPVLRQLLANEDKALFSDQVVARVCGMLGHVARQLLHPVKAGEMKERSRPADERQEEVTQLLLKDGAFLSHAHALALEAQITEQLKDRSGIDCVASSLLQDLTTSNDGQMVTCARDVVASQARFVQQQRRMELPLCELSEELFDEALLVLRSHAGKGGAEAAERHLRAQFDGSEGRLDQIARLVTAIGGRVPDALSVRHAGLAVFATALSMASGQDRDLVILSFGENQLARLALSLRAAGLGQGSIKEQFLYFHRDVELPGAFEKLGAERAAALLAGSEPGTRA